MVSSANGIEKRSAASIRGDIGIGLGGRGMLQAILNVLEFGDSGIDVVCGVFLKSAMFMDGDSRFTVFEVPINCGILLLLYNPASAVVM
jgi:hypothetical protein